MQQNHIHETFLIHNETQKRIQNLIINGVFKDLQNFTDTAIIQFLNSFDHAKINPQQTQKSLCKFRVFTESMDDLFDFLQNQGIQGHFNTILVDYQKIDNGDFLMHHVKRGNLRMVFEVDIYEQNSNLKDGEEYIFD